MAGRKLSELKITFLAGTLGQGGAERQLFYMVTGLVGSGATVRVLCLTRGEYWETKIQRLGVPVVWVGEPRSRWARLGAIIDELRADPPHIIQSQHFYTNLYVTMAARRLGILEIGAIRSNVEHELRSNGAVLGRLSLRAPRLLMANSKRAIENAIRRKVPPSRLCFLGNTVDTELFRPNCGPRSGPVRLLSVGRLTEVKRHDRFLRVLAEVRRSGADVRGVIAGGGSLHTQLEAQALDLGLRPPVMEFLGAVEEPAALTRLYQDCDILVLTSDSEGAPNAVLEGMACGLPVVATRVGGVPEVIEDGETGFLIEREDEQTFAARLLDLVHDEALREDIGSEARRFITEHHSIAGLPEELRRIYMHRFALADRKSTAAV